MTQELNHAIRTDFCTFHRRAFLQCHGYNLGQDHYVDVLRERIDRFARTPGDRLIIAMPPRHLKTFSASVCAAAWLLAIDPSTKIMIISNSESLATPIARQILTIMKARWYSESFPATRLAYQPVMDFGTTAGGGVYAVSVDGTLTGRGADVIIVDDPMHIEDASNIEQIQKINSLFDVVIRSRLNSQRSGRIMVVAHRIHRDDLAGHLLHQGGWDLLKLPFKAAKKARYKTQIGTWVRKKGELLRPGEYTKKMVKALEASDHYETLYQQNPDNGIEPINADCFLPLLPNRPPSSAPVVLSIDPGHIAGPDNSCTVAQAWCPYGGQHILLDQFQESCSFATALRAIRRFISRYRPSVILIENTGYGPGLHDEIKHDLGAKLVLVPHPQRSKKARLATHIKLILGGAIGLLTRSECASKFVDELIAFPNGTHDDIVDALTQYLDFMATNPVLPSNPAPRVCGVLQLLSAPSSIAPTPVASRVAVMQSRGAARGMQHFGLWGMPTPIEPRDTHPVLVATPNGHRWKSVR